MAEKEKEVKQDEGLRVVNVATETQETIIKDGDPISERQLLVEIYTTLKSIERAVK